MGRHPTAHAAAPALRAATPADVEPAAAAPAGRVWAGAAASPDRVLRLAVCPDAGARWAQRGQDTLDRGPAVLDGRELCLQLLREHRRGTIC